MPGSTWLSRARRVTVTAADEDVVHFVDDLGRPDSLPVRLFWQRFSRETPTCK